MPDPRYPKTTTEPAGDLTPVIAAEVGYGCILFDGGQPGPGWCCVAGDEPRRIDGLASIGSGCLWLTNANYQTMMFGNGAGQNPWLRHDGYLRLRVDQILSEWGLTSAAPDEAAAWLADMFDRVMRYAGALLPDKDWSKRTLVEEMMSAWPEPEMPTGQYAASIRQALRESLQEWTCTPCRTPKDNITIKLWRPRNVHFRDMLTVPIPTGPWELAAGGDLPPREARMEWLVHEQTRPALTNILIQQDYASEDLAVLFAFGGGAKNDSGDAMRRSWCTHPELVALHNLSPVDVDAVFLGESYGTLPMPFVDESALQRLQSPIGALSWSAGIVLENLWMAATRPGIVRRPDQTRRRAVSYRGAWLRAHDRLAMFIHASKMSKGGWLVTSYGTGAIWVSVDPGNIPAMLADAFRVGLLPSLQHIQSVPGIRGLSMELDPANWGGGEEGVIEAIARYGARGDEMSTLDGLPDYEDDEIPGVLENMLANLA